MKAPCESTLRCIAVFTKGKSIGISMVSWPNVNWCKPPRADEAASTPGRWRKGGDVVTITLEPDTEKREIEIPSQLQRKPGTKLIQELTSLSFTHKKVFIVWYSQARKEGTRARRVEKMKQMLSAGKVVS